MLVGLTLGQRRDDSTDVGPTLSQPTLLSGLCQMMAWCQTAIDAAIGTDIDDYKTLT